MKNSREIANFQHQGGLILEPNVQVPHFMANINTPDSLDMNAEREIDADSLNPELNKMTLRGYQLHDNIILSNYENITQLEVTENNIEYLDLSTLKKLEVLQCRRNKLNELTLNGESLVSLTASYNDLTRVSISPAPIKLSYLDIRCNKLCALPQWLDKCHDLQTFYASNNLLEELPNHLINSERNSLRILHLANNKLRSLPSLPSKEKIPLRELCLQCNQLKTLPENLFFACNELIVLNISNNKLETLPTLNEGISPLERLFATKNLLNDTILDSFMHFKKIKVLHVAYNNFTNLPSKCISNWTELEELVVSGNKLKSLPENISSLRKLRVLRLHSNHIQAIPDLSKVTTLRVIDLAHNQLGKINLLAVLPKSVQFLDLSCNQQLQVDSNQLKNFQSQRKISFVDVSGKNRFSLPTSIAFENNCNSYTPWKVGFSETSGNRPKLYISQLRLPNFCNTDGLFGMFDGEIRATALRLLPKIIPTILLQQHTVKDTSADYMKYTLISAYKKLKQNDKNYGECAILCHITKEKQCHELSVKPLRSRKYILRAAMVGGSTAYLIRKQGPVHLPPTSSKAGFENDNSPIFVTDADIFEISLSNDDEFLVIGSKRIWETMQIETVVQEIRSEENVILAAKRIQDVAQSLGAEENLSIIILKFQNVETYVDLLIHELRQNVRKKTGFYNCPGYCYAADRNVFGKQLYSPNSGRSSPIGQTDQEISELSVCLKRIKSDTYCFAESGISSFKLQSCGEDNLSRTPCHAVEEESEQTANETDSVLSEEQFKCWEYMLEQNTQLLFDKELNKISNSLTKSRNSASTMNLNDNATTFNLMQSANKKKISASFPQLIYKDIKEYPSYRKASCTSKQFGTARSFQQFSSIKSTSMNSTDSLLSPTAVSGANVGYFGSLQNLMPYNFENDFTVTHERQIGDESLEYASRMSQYWGVATTEL